MRPLLCLLLAAIVLIDQVVAGETEAEVSSGDQVSSAATEGQSKSPRLIKRIIRVRSSEPPSSQADQESPNGEPAQTPSISNNVDVQPNISVQVPNAQGGPQVSNDGSDLPQNMRSNNKKVNKVPYKPRHRHGTQPTNQEPSGGHQLEPIIEEPSDEDVMQNVGGWQQEDNSKQMQIVPYQFPPTLPPTPVPPTPQVTTTIENTGNNKNTVLRDIGNTETVHVEGVGNQRLTKVAASDNKSSSDLVEPKSLDERIKKHKHHPNCEHNRRRQPTVVETSGLATGGAPLVQVNIRDKEMPVQQATAMAPAAPAAPAYLIPIVSDAALVDIRSANLVPNSSRPKQVVAGLSSNQAGAPGDVNPAKQVPAKQYMLVQQQQQQPMMLPPGYPMRPMWPMPPPYPMQMPLPMTFPLPPPVPMPMPYPYPYPYSMPSPPPPYPMDLPPPSPFFWEGREPPYFREPRRRRHHGRRRKDRRREERRYDEPETPPTSTPVPVPVPAESEPTSTPTPTGPETSTELPSTTPKPSVNSRLGQLRSWLPEIAIRETPGESAPKQKEEIEWETIRVPKIKKKPE